MNKTTTLEENIHLNTETNPKANFGWLTEHSRNFLAAGYLTPGLTGKRRKNIRDTRLCR